MAQKRKRKRKRKGPPPQRQSKTLPIARRSILRRLPAWLWFCIVLATVVVTLGEGWPWLSVSEVTNLDSHNPYSTVFQLSNAGYIPAVNLDAKCVSSFSVGTNSFDSVSGGFSHFAKQLNHSDRADIPCFRSFVGGPFSDVKHLDVVITYSVWPFHSEFRISKTFRFSLLTTSANLPYWTFEN